MRNIFPFGLPILGMLQYTVWIAIEASGLELLQHYNPLIDEEVKKRGICQEWKLLAQMPFGTPVNPMRFSADDDRFKMFSGNRA